MKQIFLKTILHEKGIPYRMNEKAFAYQHAHEWIAENGRVIIQLTNGDPKLCKTHNSVDKYFLANLKYEPSKRSIYKFS